MEAIQSEGRDSLAESCENCRIPNILSLAFLFLFLPIFGILAWVDSTSPYFWIYAAIAFCAVEIFVIACVDLIFIRTVLGQQAWIRWQTFWGNKTHWVLAALNTLVCTPVFGFLLLTCFFGDNMSAWEIKKASIFMVPALGLFCAFAFGLSIFRDHPSLLRGGLTYGFFTILLLIIGFWKWL